MTMNLFTDSDAIFSPCKQYRYTLTRRFLDNPRTLNFLMLNPSTATEFEDDPTVARCGVRVSQLGFGTLIVTNLFAWRSTDPKVLPALVDPIGVLNDYYIRDTAEKSEMVICAWGRHGSINGRNRDVLRLLAGIPLHYLKLNQNGDPAHPLYLGYNLQPQPWQ